jgi:hypothetical protein
LVKDLTQAQAERDRYKEILEWVRDVICGLPGGIDEEANPDNPSPEDAVAHLGGLIWQKVAKVLNDIAEKSTSQANEAPRTGQDK